VSADWRAATKPYRQLLPIVSKATNSIVSFYRSPNFARLLESTARKVPKKVIFTSSPGIRQPEQVNKRGSPSYTPSVFRSLGRKNDQVEGWVSNNDQVKGLVSKNDQLQYIEIAVYRFFKLTI